MSNYCDEECCQGKAPTNPSSEPKDEAMERAQIAVGPWGDGCPVCAEGPARHIAHISPTQAAELRRNVAHEIQSAVIAERARIEGVVYALQCQWTRDANATAAAGEGDLSSIEAATCLDAQAHAAKLILATLRGDAISKLKEAK